MDTELIAVNELIKILVRAPKLRAFIQANDRTPFTDGHIDLHRSVPISKKTWLGRVPIQVKGRSSPKIDRESISFRIPRVDLEAYQRDSGVVFFVVLTDKKSHESSVYYALLSPFAIASHLQAISSGKAATVTLKPFPTDPDAATSVIALALKTRDQDASQGIDSALFERMVSFTLHTAGPLDLDAPLILKTGEQDFALVMRTEDGMSIPIGGAISIGPAEYAEQHVDIEIACGPVVYKGGTSKRVSVNKTSLRLSPGLSLQLELDAERVSGQISLQLEADLASRLKSVQFYVSLMNTRMLTINGDSSPFAFAVGKEDRQLERHLHWLQQLRELFEHLHVDLSLIQLDKLDEQQVRKLRVLYQAFVKGEDVRLEDAEMSRALEWLGDWAIIFLILPGTTDGLWRLVNPFDLEGRMAFRLEAQRSDTKSYGVITAYDMLELDHFATVLNLRLDIIVDAYAAIAELPQSHDLANRTVLQLISAADAAPVRSTDLLQAAVALSEWLMSETVDNVIYKLNRWQALTRLKVLSHDERDSVRSLRRDLRRGSQSTADKDDVEIACAILLSESEEVAYLMEALPTARRAQIMSWPIWALAAQTQTA